MEVDVTDKQTNAWGSITLLGGDNKCRQNGRANAKHQTRFDVEIVNTTFSRSVYSSLSDFIYFTEV